MCSTDDDLFYDLEFDDCTIAAMTIEGHYDTWEELADTPLEEITYLGGLETYLEYCRENNITKESIQKAVGLEVCDIMERLDKIRVFLYREWMRSTSSYRRLWIQS